MLTVSSAFPHGYRVGDRVRFHDPRPWWVKVRDWLLNRPALPSATVIAVPSAYTFITDEDAQ